jgi:DNA-binding NarL/FixJ family response regulator
LPAPAGVVAERLSVGGDEFVLFSWDVPTGDDRALEALSAAERDVLERVARGASNQEIATARRVSARTVANQVAALLRKLDARSRLDLIRRFARGRSR